jgi:ABC-type transport system involved in cytochrome bd biosynthesis fused ATPase/permease subunit
MRISWPVIAGWYHAVLLAALPWCAWWDPRWAPLMVAGIALVHLQVRRTAASEPWSSVSILVVASVFLTTMGGWRGPIGWWLAFGAVVAVTARILPREGGGRPDAADILALGGWAAVFAFQPTFLETTGGGWLAPAVLLIAARRLGTILSISGSARPSVLGPPTREVRGTLSLRGVVVTSGGLPSTVPIDLDLRAGESMAVLCDDPTAAQALADVITGRTKPDSGEILIDGGPVESVDRLVAVVGPGEPFVEGGLDHNLGALRDEPPDRAARGAARDACGLAEVVGELAGRSMAVDGSPLSIYHRLLVLAARVLVSHYRVVVVLDPAPWVDLGRKDVWRAALVRASVGRTSIWITGDPELADRAEYVHEFRGGALRGN